MAYASRLHLLVLVMCIAAGACTSQETAQLESPSCVFRHSASASNGSWNDTSPHESHWLDVDGARLHYLDWGGDGMPLLFLSGLGNTAHVFDQFAPCFTSRHRVLALTRRGFGESDWAESGYDRLSLANDILALVDLLNIDQVTLIGHSFAGEEMTRFAGAYPERTAGLVYLDAAFDRIAYAEALPPYPGTQPPPATAADSASLASMHQYLDYLFRVPLPRAEVRAMFTTAPDGSIAGRTVGQSAREQIGQYRESPDYASVQAPALAIYKASRPELELPWADSTTILEVHTWLERHLYPEFERQLADFLSMPGACAYRLQGYHYVFLSNPREVHQLIEAFLLDGKCDDHLALPRPAT